MDTKEKWTAINDAAEATELLQRRGELDTPTLYAPNGLLWAVAEEYRAWREHHADKGREPGSLSG